MTFILQKYKNHSKIPMDSKGMPHNQNNLENEERSWRSHIS